MPDGFDHVPFDDLEAMDAACDPTRVAAVLVEPIMGEAGVVVPSSDYLGGLRQLCTDRGHPARWWTRSRPGSGAPGGGSGSSTSASYPTW